MTTLVDTVSATNQQNKLILIRMSIMQWFGQDLCLQWYTFIGIIDEIRRNLPHTSLLYFEETMQDSVYDVGFKLPPVVITLALFGDLHFTA